MWNIKGDRKTLLAEHGYIDINRCLGAICSKIGDEDVDINKINAASSNGMLYVKADGTILSTCSKDEEDIAKYKIVPTGLFLKGTRCPILASFMKFRTKAGWQGVYIGTGEQLFKMYKQHYVEPQKFNNDYINIFCGEYMHSGIIGFGLNEVLKNREMLVSYTDDKNNEVGNVTLYDSMKKAIDKCLLEAESCDNSTKGKRDAKKAKQKAEMLKSRLAKMEAKQHKKEKTQPKEENVEQPKEENVEQPKEEIRHKEETQHKEDNVEQQKSDPVNQELASEILSESDVKEAKKISTKTENTETKTKVSGTKNDKIVENSKSSYKKSKLKDIRRSNESMYGNDDEGLHSHRLCSANQSYEPVVTRFLDNLYSRLLYKESWMTNGRYRLDFYVRNLIKILEYERQQSGNKARGNGYVYSSDKIRCILNLGILDMYGNEIYILDSTPNKGDFKCKDLSIIDSKFELLGIGFTQDTIKNLPEIFNMRNLHKETVFDANTDDFDLMDIVRLNHLIEERRSRFPKKYINESPKVLCDRLKESIVQAVKISKTDCRYIVPKYDFFRHQVQFMVPFHLDKELHDIPELAIIVGKNKGIWCVYTILPIDDALADARILFRPTSWLRI